MLLCCLLDNPQIILMELAKPIMVSVVIYMYNSVVIYMCTCICVRAYVYLYVCIYVYTAQDARHVLPETKILQ